MEELVSVIVPIYNVEKYIKQCIDSIINQTYINLEIILVNDGSTDSCGKICDEYAEKDTRIKVIHQKNGGVSCARNIALDNANGKWISFVDADDWIEDCYFEKLLDNAKREDVDVVLCGYNRVTSNSITKINANGKSEEFNTNEYLIKALNPQTGFGFSAMKIIKKQVIKNTKFDTELSVGEDALFNIEISQNIRRAVFVKEALYNYRNNNESVVKKFDENYANKYLNSMKKNKKYIFEKCNNKEIVQNYYNFVAFHVMLIAVNYCYHQENMEKNKLKLLKEICNENEYKEGLQKSNYNNLSLTRRITLFTLKHKLFVITALICRIRQKQNKK